MEEVGAAMPTGPSVLQSPWAAESADPESEAASAALPTFPEAAEPASELVAEPAAPVLAISNVCGVCNTTMLMNMCACDFPQEGGIRPSWAGAEVGAGRTWNQLMQH